MTLSASEDLEIEMVPPNPCVLEIDLSRVQPTTISFVRTCRCMSMPVSPDPAELHRLGTITFSSGSYFYKVEKKVLVGKVDRRKINTVTWLCRPVWQFDLPGGGIWMVSRGTDSDFVNVTPDEVAAHLRECVKVNPSTHYHRIDQTVFRTIDPNQITAP